MLTPLSEKDKSLAVAQEAYKKTNITGNARNITANLDFIANQVSKIIYDEIGHKNTQEETKNNPKEGSFSLLNAAGDIEEAVKAAIASQVLAVYRQDEEKYIKEPVDITSAHWLLESFNCDTNINQLRGYIASVIKLVCENIIILSHGKHNDSKVIRASGQLAKGWNADFTQDFFHGDLIQKTLDETGIKISSEEISQWVKWRFAVDYSDPLSAITKTAEHLKSTLTDENIQKAIREVGVKMTTEEIKNTFTEARKLSFAVNNTDPLDAVSKIAKHLNTTLADENIQEAVRKIGVEIKLEEIKNTFTKKEKWYFAERYKDPLSGIRKAAKHLQSTLTDDKIQNCLLRAGINIMPKKIEKTFTKKIRLHLAASYSNPLMACVRYVRGEISYGPHHFCP